MSLIDDFSDDSTLSELSRSPSPPPSSPLSDLPDSPIPPPNWFTPPPSHSAGDDRPPARKRRKIEPRTRTTRHLDLTSETAQCEFDHKESWELLRRALRGRRKIVVIAGAGISVSAGIPDFRSSQGLFTSLRNEHGLKSSGKALFDAAVYKDDTSTSQFHDMVRKLSQMSASAKPTAFHRMLARLSTEGRLLRLYTQNVDGLETSLPPLATKVPLAHKGPWPQTIQLHGGLEKMTCQKCRQVSEFDEALFDGPVPPPCPSCVAEDDARTNVAGKRSHGIGRLRPRIVLYNEHNPDDEAIGAVTTADFRTRPDAVVVVGTSMKIPGVRRIVSQMCRIVRDRREGTTIWINRDGIPTGKDLEDCWDLVVKGDSDDVARIADLKEWDDPTPDVVEEYTDSDVERVKASQGEISVNIPVSPEKSTLLGSTLVKNLAASAMTPPRSQNGESERKSVKKASPVKLKITLPVRKGILEPGRKTEMTEKTLKNPASSGTKLTDILSQQPIKRKPGRPRTNFDKKPVTKRKKTDSDPGQGKLTMKVVKSANVKSTTSKYDVQPPKKSPLSPKKAADLNSDRRNINVLPTPQDSSADPSPTISPRTPPSTMSRTPSWSGPEIVSPSGSIPKGMEKLLN